MFRAGTNSVASSSSRLLPTKRTSLVSVPLQKGIVPCNYLEPVELQNKLHIQVRSPGGAGVLGGDTDHPALTLARLKTVIPSLL